MDIVHNIGREEDEAMNGAQPTNLIDILISHAETCGSDPAYTFLDQDGATQWTYSELEARARSVAVCLRQLADKGDRVLLLFPPGLEFVAGFCGCLYGGLIAVPAYPPHRNHGAARVQAIAADCGAQIILTTQSILKEAQPNLASADGAGVVSGVAFEEIGPAPADWKKPDLAPNDIAFLQYTSGSTAAPKGVIVSHGNLMANEEKIRKSFGQNKDSVIVSWLPLYHDMGLIGSVLQSLYVGARCILFSPVAFLQSPVKWLQAISQFRATTSGGPNFAYDLCVRKVTREDLAGLDLSSWTVAFNGAEPVRADTLERFASGFAGCGFRREAFRPCYGLAEATLLVTAGGSREPVTRSVQAEALAGNRVVDATEDGNSRVLVGCGSTDSEDQLRIVNPSTLAPCAAGEVGEIWLSGPSVAQGYWRKATETKESFFASMNTGEGHFLRTGDLGAVVAGEMFVTGRLKDLIIIRGRNHYPQDIERTVELSHPALRQGCSAAFAMEVGQEERAVVVQEIDRHDPVVVREALSRIKAAVSEEHELQLHAIVLVRRGAVPKTSSGKIQRQLCKSWFIAGKLSVIESWMENASAMVANPDDNSGVLRGQFSPQEIAEWLRSRIAHKLGLRIEEIDQQSSIVKFGIDSLAAVELAHEIESALGIRLPFIHLFQETSIYELAAEIAQQKSQGVGSMAVAVHAGEAGNEQRPSRGQSAMWFLHRMAPGSTAYNIAAAASIHSALQVETLQRAFEQIVARHDSLRTIFPSCDGRPVRRVCCQVPEFFQHVNASGWTEARLDEELNKEATHKFDLENGPLFRIIVFSSAPDCHVLLMVAHHIIADFWSLSVVLRELGALYTGQTNLPAPLNFDEYVRWQENMLSGDEGQRHWSFWNEQFSGEFPVLDLPADHTRPAVQTYSGATELLACDRGLTPRLRHLAKAHGVTLYTALLAAFEILLYRYTRQASFVVGTPVANRNLPAFTGLVGLVANTVAVKAEIAGDLTAAEFMDRTRERVLAALEHQEYPFALLIERLQPARDPSRSPLFQVMFAVNKIESQHARHLGSFTFPGAHCTIDLGALVLHSRPLLRSSSQFDLALQIAEDDEGITSYFEYNTSLFERETVRRMARHYHRLLDAITEDPSQLIKNLPLLTQREEEELLVHWNRSALEVPPIAMHALFEEQARRAPTATAVVFEGKHLTYKELDCRANQLANYLRGHAIGPESRVGVCLERSLDLVVALLAVLKAGGAYVPMDPEYPAERLSFMMRDASMCAVITLQSLQGKFAGSADLIFVDAAQKQIARMSVGSPGVEVCLRNAAYVIYTSGSTGVPKGVIVHHLGLINLLWDMHERLSISEKDRWLSVTTVSFDIAGLELYLPLITGAQLWLAGRDDVRSGKRLCSLLEQSQATIMQATPVTWQSLIEEGWSGTPGLTALCGGEAMPQALAPALLARTPMVWNVYGPTETTIWSSAYRLPVSVEKVLIGSPLANTQLYVLDQEYQPVPIGVTGDLYIGGAGVARGYFHRPDLSAEKFIPDPFGERGSRLYTTGDLARYRTDGNVEFLGRADNQVKFRGFRIELGEIEACLGRHSAVEQVAVVRRGDSGKERLIGYVVLRQGMPCSGAELRDFVKQSLPEYMTPSLFVILAAMPLTPNGKIDRNALPQAEQDAQQEQLTRPRNATEEILAGIWCQVLRVEQAGIRDNFFELGGHSLLAAQVTSRIAEAFGVELPLRALFEDSTIEALARRIEQSDPAEQTGLALRPVIREKASVLSFAQQQLWFLDQLEPGDSAYHVRGAVRLKGSLQRDALENALQELIFRHEILRTRFVACDGVPEQVIDASQTIQLQEIDITSLPEDERNCKLQEISRQDLATPFHLAEGPLFRGTLVRTNVEEHVLLVTMHHIVSDGWSIGVLTAEFAEFYNASVEQRTPKLQPLLVQYADYAVWQRGWLNTGHLQRQLEYWRKQLEGVPMLEMPSQLPAPTAGAAHLADRVRLEFPTGLTAQLRALSQRENASVFMVLTATLQLLLYHYSGQRDIAVGTPIANRTRPQIEGLIGFFVNVLVLRTLIDPERSFRDFLKSVREVTLQAYAHQDVPFEKVVEELVPLQNRKSPFFRIMLVLQSAFVPDLRLSGLDVSQEITEPGKAKFDLTLSLEERDGQILGFIEYDTDIFDRDMVSRMANHYQVLMEALVACPEDPLWSLTPLSSDEREQLLLGWNRTATEYPREKSVSLVFEEQAEQTPNTVALVYEGQRLTYGELNQWANKLAHYLRKLGVRSEARVAVCLERSFDMVVALLGILKAGGTYVPLDPEYPSQRLEYIVTNTAADVVLTSFALQNRLLNVEATVVPLDAEWKKISLSSEQNLKVEVLPQGLAYVLYTSGSTGNPKGVAVTHQSILRLVKGANYARLGPEETVLQFAPLSFDASTFEIWGALLNGGQLAIVPKGIDALQDLGSIIGNYRVTTVWLTAALFHQIVEREPESLAGVKQLLSGGDVVSPQAAVRAIQQGCTVINGYGPTENTTFTSCYTVQDSQAATASIPIGRPVPNTEIYVLDEYLQPAPIGVPGELYTGGAGLARGYWGEPQLTATKFIPNPFSRHPGGRLYKTGDLVCYRPDGNLIFLGRKDEQVKIRGYRIEPGEIEVQLSHSAGVGQAVVIARELGGNKQLVAYIVLKEGAEWNPENLRDHLKQRLPGHMIPAHFVRVENIPVTRNGKVDRKRLLELELEAADDREFVPLQTAAEELLANIWKEVLHVERVGATDNFFALGGHSLLATQVISRVRRTFQIEAPLRLLFESDTLAEMAEALAGNPQTAPALTIRRVTQMREEVLITQIEKMSEEEMDNLIESLSATELAANTASL